MVENHFPWKCSLRAIIVVSAAFCLLSTIVNGQGIHPWPTETPIDPGPGVDDEAIVKFRMKGAMPTKDNATECTGFKMKDNQQFSIIQVGGVASWSTVHHIGLYGCDYEPTGNACSCPMNRRTPIYAWSRNTNTVRFAGPGTYSGGFVVGGSYSDTKFLFIETHYHGALNTADNTSGIDIHITRTTVEYNILLYSVMSKGTIPKNTTKYFLDACVTVPDSSISIFSYFLGLQAHSHNLGRLVSAFYLDRETNKTYEIGRGNPVWPQVYRATPVPDPSSTNVDDNRIFLKSGSTIFSRCYYSSSGVTFDVNTIGLPKTTWTEMCMSNILIGTQLGGGSPTTTKNALLTGTCTPEQSDFITKTWPQSTELLPANADLDNAAVNGGTGIVSVSSDYSVNLGTESFGAYL